MRPPPFVIHRPDGRSNQQVVIDLVRAAQPEHLYTYADIAAALEADQSYTYAVTAVQGIVRQAGPRLSKELARALTNVPGVGYRVARAGEHVGLALTHSRKSEAQLHRGFELLSHVRTEEMTDNERQAHEGHLLITGALYQNQRLMWKKQQQVERALVRLTARVEALAPDAGTK